MITTELLSKSYGSQFAVKQVSFQVDSCRVVGLLGQNGAGKTTLLEMLASLLRPDSGKIEIAGINLYKNPRAARHLIGYLPDQPPLYPELKVNEYLNFVGRLHQISKPELNYRIEEVLERCLLTEVKNKLIHTLSRGFKQRVGLAQAVLHKPKLILLDEPTSGLDPQQIVLIQDYIRELGTRHTVILSSHLLAEVQTTCTEVLVMSHGEISARGSVAELTREHSLEDLFFKATSGIREKNNADHNLQLIKQGQQA
ncbi:ABC transporter ATP-binding protein [bacterium]|nr:ABC transporter ATP-binding protein [bacterium]